MTTTPRSAGIAAEDYVRAIYVHTEWQQKEATTTGLAARLGLAPSSVTEMVRKLVDAGLASRVPYGGVSLTAAGEALAVRMTRRHRLIETWLVTEFGYGWHEVHDEAEVLEHSLSDRMLDLIDVRLGRPTRDPHGDPIPSATGEVHRPDAVSIGEAKDGCHGRVVRISDRDPALLERLADHGIGLDTEVGVVVDRGARGIRLPNGDDVALDDDAAASIWVTSTEQPVRGTGEGRGRGGEL